MKLKRKSLQTTNPANVTLNQTTKLNSTDNNDDNKIQHTVNNTTKHVSNDIDDIFTQTKKSKLQTTHTNDNDDENSSNSENDELDSEDERFVDLADTLDDEQVTKLIAQKVLSKKQQHNNNNNKQQNTKNATTVPIDDFGFTRHSTQSNNVRGYTDDGYKIYTADELKVSMPDSGATPQCPFDCQCCY